MSIWFSNRLRSSQLEQPKWTLVSMSSAKFPLRGRTVRENLHPQLVRICRGPPWCCMAWSGTIARWQWGKIHKPDAFDATKFLVILMQHSLFEPPSPSGWLFMLKQRITRLPPASDSTKWFKTSYHRCSSATSRLGLNAASSKRLPKAFPPQINSFSTLYLYQIISVCTLL
jgi:hypothetical protein